VLDAASKTAEGIKNTATAFDHKASESKSRYPRAFYGKEKYYRAYVDTDAEAMWLYANQQKVPVKDLSLLCSFDICPDEKEKDKLDSWSLLMISYELIICWKKNKIIWSITPDNIEKVISFSEGMQIYLNHATPEFKVKS